MRAVAFVVAVTALLIAVYLAFLPEDGAQAASGSAAVAAAQPQDAAVATSGLSQEDIWALEDAAAADLEAAERDAEQKRRQAPESIPELVNDGLPAPDQDEG